LKIRLSIICHPARKALFLERQGVFMRSAVVILILTLVACNNTVPMLTSISLSGKIAYGWDQKTADLYGVFNRQYVKVATINADGSFKAQWQAPADNDLLPGTNYSNFDVGCILKNGVANPPDFQYRFADFAVFRGQTLLGHLGGYSKQVVAGAKAYTLLYVNKPVTINREFECQSIYLGGGAYTNRYTEQVSYNTGWNVILYTYTRVSADGLLVDTKIALASEIPTDSQWYLRPPNPTSAGLRQTGSLIGARR
jgi:hypothetical protein